MSRLKWFFMSKYKKLLYAIDCQYSNKGGLWLYTKKHTFRLDFKSMKIEKMVWNEIQLPTVEIERGGKNED
jgi:hypothetical protein